MSIFKNGDRVHWLGEAGKEVHGTVVRAGKKSLRVIADGGKIVASGPVECFEKSDIPVKTFPSNMDKYSVRKYRYTGGEETPQFSAEIILNGKRIANASNAGTGGGNTYYGDMTAIAKARTEADIWAMETGAPSYETLDSWLEWYVNARPYGVDPKEYFAEMKTATGNPA